jgi:hypothetical protein
VVVHTCNPRYLGSRVGRSQSEGSPDKNVRAYLKNKLKAKRTEGVNPLVDLLPSKYKVLSSNPSIIKKKRKKLP